MLHDITEWACMCADMTSFRGDMIKERLKDDRDCSENAYFPADFNLVILTLTIQESCEK